MSSWTRSSSWSRQDVKPFDTFRMSSPWSEDKLPNRPDTSQAVFCGECSKRFLSQEWLDKHLAEGHDVPKPKPKPERDLEEALTPAPGRMPSAWQNVARRVLGQIAAGEYSPGDEVLIKTFANESAPWLAQKAFALLMEHGVLRRTGTARHTQYWVPDDH